MIGYDKDHNNFQCNSGDLVYIISPLTSHSKNSIKKGCHKVCRTIRISTEL